MVNRKKQLLRILLLPLAWLYGMITKFRNFLFDKEILPSESFPTVVITIGNITVGGTGKTPHTEYFIELLKEKFNVAVLSRGYKRKTIGYVCASPKCNAQTIGDEPYQMYQKFPEVTIAVDANRRNGIKTILASHPSTNVVLLDDAYQHRYVKANQTILLVDYNRMITRDKMLPYGRLRESAEGKSRADIVIVTKCPCKLTPIEARNIIKTLKLLAYQDIYFSCYQYQDIVAVFPPYQIIPNKVLKKEQYGVLLVTGIAEPTPLIEHIETWGKSVETLILPDHHFFTPKDMTDIIDKFENLPVAKRIILVTEKDAARIVNDNTYPHHLKPFTFKIPIKVNFLYDQQKIINSKIINYVSKNQRNSSVSKSKNGKIS